MAFGGSAMMVVFVLTGLLHGAAATTYTVGENIGGWTIPSSSNVFDQQFSSITLVQGDILLFPFTSGEHNVYEVSQSDLAACNGDNPIKTYTDTNSTVTLSNAKTYFFICNIAGHCSAGMHLQVTVGSSAPAPTTASPAPSTKAPAPTPKAASPAPSTKAPAPAPKAGSPQASSPSDSTPTTFPPASAPGLSGASALLSRSATGMIVGSLLAGWAFLLL